MPTMVLFLLFILLFSIEQVTHSLLFILLFVLLFLLIFTICARMCNGRRAEIYLRESVERVLDTLSRDYSCELY